MKRAVPSLLSSQSITQTPKGKGKGKGKGRKGKINSSLQRERIKEHLSLYPSPKIQDMVEAARASTAEDAKRQAAALNDAERELLYGQLAADAIPCAYFRMIQKERAAAYKAKIGAEVRAKIIDLWKVKKAALPDQMLMAWVAYPDVLRHLAVLEKEVTDGIDKIMPTEETIAAPTDASLKGTYDLLVAQMKLLTTQIKGYAAP